MRAAAARPLGREPVIEAFARELAGGDPKGLALVGPPWSGGTHLARYLGEAAREAGWEPFEVRAAPGLTDIGCGVLAPLLEQVGSVTDLDDLLHVRSILQGDPARRVLVIDDAQHLDDLTSSLLGQLGAGSLVPILVVSTDDPAVLPDGLVAALRHTSIERYDLWPLDDRTIGEVVDRAAGGPVDPLTKVAIVARSSGLPGLAAELTLEAVRSGALSEHGRMLRQRGEIRIPASVRDRVVPRLRALGADARRLVDAVAEVGDLPRRLVGEVFGEDLLLEETVQALVGVRIDGHRHVVHLQSAILADVARSEVTSAERIEIARLLRGGLESTRLRRQDDPLLLATLALLAGDAVTADEALAWASRANTLGRIELALTFATRAVELRPQHIAANCLRAELLGMVGRNREADQLLAELSPATPEDVALVAMTRAHNLFNRLDQGEQALEVLRDAIEAVDRYPWADELRGLVAVFTMYGGRPGDALALVEPLLETGEGRNFVQGITAAAPSLVFAGRPDEAIELARRGFDERVALGDQTMLAHAGIHLVAQSLALGEAGRIDEAIEMADLIDAGSASEGSKDGMLWAALVGGRAMLPAGRLDEAARRFEAGSDLAAELGLRNHARWALAGLVLALTMQGRMDEARRAATRLDAVPASTAMLMSTEATRAQAWVAAASGDPRSARKLLAGAAAEASINGQHLIALLALHDAVRLDLGLPAEDLVRTGEEVSGRFAAVRVAHGVALEAGDSTGLAAAADSFEALGAHLLAAEAANQAATTASRDGRARDAEALRHRVEVLLARCPQATTPALAWNVRSAVLTRREREVAQCAAAGLPSKEIAANLDISVRTVNNLLQRAYGKLSVHDRSQLAAELSRTRQGGT